MSRSDQSSFLTTISALNERYLIDVDGVRELWFVRHADSYSKLSGDESQLRDPSLSELGRKQADRLAERLADVGLQSVWASDAARARETAEVIAAPHGLPVHFDTRFREIRTQWDEEGRSTLRPQGEYPFPEPEADVIARMSEAAAAVLDKLEPTAGTPVRAVVVGHTAALLAYLNSVAGVRWGQLRMMLCHTSVSVVVYRNAVSVVRSIGDVTHLALPIR